MKRRGLLGGILALSLSVGIADAAATKAEGVSTLGKGVDEVVLTTDAGVQVRWRELNGKPRAVFFGFTHCPVICPVTVYEIDAALAKIGKPADNVQVIFVSLDPARDTPAVLKNYFSGFNGRVRALTGTAQSTARVAKAFEVDYDRVPLTGKDYTLDHTAAVFLVDEAGAVTDTVAYGAGPDVMADRLRRLLKLPAAAPVANGPQQAPEKP